MPAGSILSRRDHDTAAFAVQTVRRWWRATGSARYQAARRLLVCGGGTSKWNAAEHRLYSQITMRAR